MGFFDKLASAATGGLADVVMDAVKTYFPPDMTEEQKAQLKLAVERLAMERERDVNQAINQAENAMNERIKLYEGSASDILVVPILGPLMLFLRGSQRIVWGFAALYLDWMWFTAWTTLTEKQEAALVIINFLVLGFLFGERALRNVAPMLTDMFKARK